MVEQRTDHPELDNPSVHHEESDINVRLVLIGAAISVVFAILMHVGLWGMYVGFRAISRSLDPEQSSRVAAPRVDPNVTPEFIVHWSEPARYLENIRNEESLILDSYGWVEREEGIVRVPIAIAMEMAVDRGFPTRREPGDPVIGSGEGEIRPPTLSRELAPGEQEVAVPEDPAPAAPRDQPEAAAEPEAEEPAEDRDESGNETEGSEQ
jgi:hypothetical protein